MCEKVKLINLGAMMIRRKYRWAFSLGHLLQGDNCKFAAFQGALNISSLVLFSVFEDKDQLFKQLLFGYCYSHYQMKSDTNHAFYENVEFEFVRVLPYETAVAAPTHLSVIMTERRLMSTRCDVRTARCRSERECKRADGSLETAG